MTDFQNAVITKVEPPLMVHSEKGRHVQMTHRRCFGLSLCISGQITYRMNGREFVSTSGTAVLLPQGATYTLTGDQDGVFPVINFLCENFTCDEILVLPLHNRQGCLNLFEGLQKAFVAGHSSFSVFSLFYQLLNEITLPNSVPQHHLAPAIKYIEQELPSTALSNQRLAEYLGISEVYLRKLFLRHLGTTPKQYILNLRLQKAKQLLTDTDRSVSSISEACGFSGVYHFSRAFKQKFGRSPTQFAAENRVFRI